jgi:hypothetical protein
LSYGQDKCLLARLVLSLTLGIITFQHSATAISIMTFSITTFWKNSKEGIVLYKINVVLIVQLRPLCWLSLCWIKLCWEWSMPLSRVSLCSMLLFRVSWRLQTFSTDKLTEKSSGCLIILSTWRWHVAKLNFLRCLAISSTRHFVNCFKSKPNNFKEKPWVKNKTKAYYRRVFGNKIKTITRLAIDNKLKMFY